MLPAEAEQPRLTDGNTGTHDGPAMPLPARHLSVTERRDLGRTVRTAVPREAHAAWQPPHKRTHPLDILEQQAIEKGLSVDELEEVLAFFRYGVPPHGGFGMGLARVMMLMLHLSNLRETTYLFRGPTRLTP